ncbi:hypothetical protein PENFLA_c004G00879 [Penicillium flavigenum]|uniref:Uncharacterized protein n=1 Tax=Penicillium flavigenum TaxID=254877 RepID=A0A1V6TSJ8_9EURO|nr:hypothetical protein PENFLA_c004G00879 [Penicillium flavigenum]
MSIAVTHIADLIPLSITGEHTPHLRIGQIYCHQRGCETGRGVLTDFNSYAQSHGISYDQFSSFRIGDIELEAVAASQGITFQAGDILLIRFGVTETLGQTTGAEKAAAMNSDTMCGLYGSK